MAAKSDMPTVYIGDTFTLDGTEVTVTDTIGIEAMGGGLVGVVVKVLSDDVHIDPTAMSPTARIVAGDDMYPTGRVSDAINYLKDAYAHTKAQHYEEYGGRAERMANAVLNVIDEVLDRLGVPSVETEEEVRAWGTNNVVRTTDIPTTVPVLGRVTSADEVVLHLDGMSFVNAGTEVEWVGADCIDNLHINVTAHVTRVWPVDDPHHLGTPLVEPTLLTVSEVKWDAVYGDGAYVDPGRVVTVDRVRVGEGVTDDRMSRAEYEVSITHETSYTDIDTMRTRDEFTADTAKEDEDNDD